MLGRHTRSLVGLDIGSSAVKVVELEPSGGGYRVVAVGAEPLPAASIVDGAIVDRGTVAAAIRRLFERHQIKTTQVAMALAGNAVIVRRITLPAMSEQELEQAIYWEAKQNIPFDIEDVHFDFQVLDSPAAVSPRGTQDVLLVAAKKERIADYTGVVENAGCTPVVVDVDALALQNAYELNYGTRPEAVVVLLNAGASSININVLNGDQSVFTRDVATGGDAYTEALQKELDLKFEEADLLKRGVPVNGVTYEDADPVIRAVSENLLLEIGRTFDFFKETTPSDRVDSIMFSGGTSRIEGLADALADRFGAHVEMLNPFRRLTIETRSDSTERPEDIGPVAAVAVGLALRRASDR